MDSIESSSSKWSKTRQIGFWVKKSLCDTVVPDLTSIYDSTLNKDNLSPVNINSTNGIDSPKSMSISKRLIVKSKIDHREKNRNDRKNQELFKREGYLFPPCRNIDEAMYGLHTLLSEPNVSPFDQVDKQYDKDEDFTSNVSNKIFEYDWILDGYSEIDIKVEEKENVILRKNFEFGVFELDKTLEGMELENNTSDDVEIYKEGKLFNKSDSSVMMESLSQISYIKEGYSKGNTQDKTFHLDDKSIQKVSHHRSLVEKGENTDNFELIKNTKSTRNGSLFSSRDINTFTAINKNEYSDFLEKSHSFSRKQKDFFTISMWNKDKSLQIEGIDLKKDSFGDSEPEVDFKLPLNCSNLSWLHEKYPTFFSRKEQKYYLSNKLNSIAEPNENIVKYNAISKLQEHTIYSFLYQTCESFGTWREILKNVKDIKTLPTHYFTDDYDSVSDILRSIPWESSWDQQSISCKKYDCSFSLYSFDSFLTKLLSFLDEVLFHVTSSLIQQITDNESDIVEGMLGIQGIELDVEHAFLCAEEASTYLQRARAHDNSLNESNTEILGAFDVIHESRQVDNLLKLDILLSSCQHVLSKDQSLSPESFMEKNISSFLKADQLAKLINTSFELKYIVHDDEYLMNLHSLDAFRKRLPFATSVMSHHLQQCLIIFLSKRFILNNSTLTCEQWNKECKDYGNMFYAFMVLQEIRLKEMKQCIEHYTANFEVPHITEWSNTLLKTLCFEIDRCLARALLEPTDVKEVKYKKKKSSFFDRNLIEIRFKITQIQASDGDTLTLYSLINNLISIRFKFVEEENYLPSVYHKLCELFSNIMHTVYILTEWHQLSSITFECNPSLDRIFSNEDLDTENKNAQEIKRGINSHIKAINRFIKSLSFKLLDSKSQPTDISQKSQNVLNRLTELITRIKVDKPYNHYQPPFSYNVSMTDFREHLCNITKSLLQIRIDIWKHCEAVIVRLLQCCLSLVKKDNLSNNRSETYPVWLYDLEGLNTILHISNQMICLSQEFLEPCRNVTNVISSLCSKTTHFELKNALCDMFCYYLHELHVEAMTSMGSMLAKETWEPFSILKCLKEIELENSKNIPNHFSHLKCTSGKKYVEEYNLWKNQFYVRGYDFSAYFPNYISLGNPFTCIENEHQVNHSMYIDLNEVMNKTLTKISYYFSSEKIKEIFSEIPFTEKYDRSHMQISTYSSIYGLAKWTCRILVILENLPLITKDITHILINIYDLYLLTVFRLCVGNEKNEKIVLGIQSRSNLHDIVSRRSKKKSSHIFHRNIIGGGSQTKSRTEKSEVNYLETEADICAPLQYERDNIEKLRSFIIRAQDTLATVVDLNHVDSWLGNMSFPKAIKLSKDESLSSWSLLQKKITASSSCVFVTFMLDASSELIQEILRSKFTYNLIGGNLKISESLHNMDCFSKEARSRLVSQTKKLIEVFPQLCLLANRMAASRAMNVQYVVKEIIAIGTGWNESKINEHCNEYIEDLSEWCSLMWGQLSSSGNKLPEYILVQVWNDLVESAYLALLEGFSCILCCSTEGRALMSIDLATFSNSLKLHMIKECLEVKNYSEIKKLPSLQLKRGMLYVDKYIKAFYFPQTDILRWIENNWTCYHLHHLISLKSLEKKDGNC